MPDQTCISTNNINKIAFLGFKTKHRILCHFLCVICFELLFIVLSFFITITITTTTKQTGWPTLSVWHRAGAWALRVEDGQYWRETGRWSVIETLKYTQRLRKMQWCPSGITSRLFTCNWVAWKKYYDKAHLTKIHLLIK